MPPDRSHQALARGGAGRTLATTVTDVLAVGPPRTIESIDQPTAPRCNGFDLLPRANSFASQLILPDYLVVPWAHGKRINLDVAKTLANDFNASLTAAAIKLAKRATTPACILCHSQSRLLWHQRNGAFPNEFFVLGELHQETDAFGIAFGAASGMSRPRKEPADRWLSGGGAYRLTIESQSIKLPDSTVLTMLSIAR